MAGEINSTNVIIKKGGSAIVGQMEATVTWGGTPIDISNKSFGDFITLMDSELAGKQIVISGTMVYNSDTVYQQMRQDTITGTQDAYEVEFVSSATTDEKISGQFVPNAMSDSLPHGDKVTTSITLSSSGAFTYTAQA